MGSNPAPFLDEERDDDVGEDKPTIFLGPDDDRFNRQVELALERSRDLQLWMRGSQLVRVVRDRSKTFLGSMEVPARAATIRSVSAAVLRAELSRHMIFAKHVRHRDGSTGTERTTAPNMLLNYLLDVGSLPIPSLAGIVEAPVILQTGRIVQTPGYDEESELMYCPPPGVRFLDVPERPTDADVDTAIAWFHDVVCDFPFVKPAHRSAWIAAVLSYFGRWAYRGPTPLFLTDKNTRGSGGTKLAVLAASICLGRKPFLFQQTSDDKAEKEMITAVALSGAMMVLIDNINRPFGSAPLDSALTETVWTPILKYSNDPTQLPLKAIWWGSGNNVQFRKHCDTVRRTIRIRVESPLQNPEERSDFKHADIDAWVEEHRPQLVWSALTLLRAFLQAGAPTAGLRTIGSYNGWSRLVRGALVWAKEADPFDAAAFRDEDADPTMENLGDLLRGWRELCHETKSDGLLIQTALTELQSELEYRKAQPGHAPRFEGLIGAIGELCPTNTGRLPNAHALGNMLRKYKKRVVGGLFFDVVEGRSHQRAWVVRGNEE